MHLNLQQVNLQQIPEGGFETMRFKTAFRLKQV